MIQNKFLKYNLTNFDLKQICITLSRTIILIKPKSMKKYFLMAFLAATTIACQNENKQNMTDETAAAKTAEKPYDLLGNVYEREWKLTEINGEVVTLNDAAERTPHFIIHKDNTVKGYLGCNTFTAVVKMTNDEKITFSDISHTEMDCPNMALEQQFLTHINQATSFYSEGNVFTLANKEGVINTRLEAK